MGLFFQRQQPQEGRYEALLAEYQNYRRRTSLALEAAEGKIRPADCRGVFAPV